MTAQRPQNISPPRSAAQPPQDAQPLQSAAQPPQDAERLYKGPRKEPRQGPQRSCIACRVTTDKRDLIRFVRTTEGTVLCDATGRKPGRGAYLCGEERCFERVRKGHLFDRALRTKLNEDEYESLAHEYRAAANAKGCNAKGRIPADSVTGTTACAPEGRAAAHTEGHVVAGRENMV
jgi:predicted RNA-binding protein YlxR (DUF448 family)